MTDERAMPPESQPSHTERSESPRHSDRPTEEQISAARMFIVAFGHISTYAGGCEVAIRLPDKAYLNTLDGWMGEAAALGDLAVELAQKMVDLPYHDRMRPLAAGGQKDPLA